MAVSLFSLPIGALYAEVVQAQREADAGACRQAEADVYLSVYNYRTARGE